MFLGLLLFGSLLAFGPLVEANSTFRPHSAIQTTRYVQTRYVQMSTEVCEEAVANYCVDSGTCTNFCNAAYRTKKTKGRCQTECTADKRCKAKLPGQASEILGNQELDTWTAELLAQCTCKERDPENEWAECRTIDWEDIMTPSLEELLNNPPHSQPSAIKDPIEVCEEAVAKHCVDNGTCTDSCKKDKLGICICEERDPENKLAGCGTIPWRDLVC